MYTRYQWIIAAPTAGMDGILVAVLARRKPALIPVTALLLAYIRTGADVVNLSTEVPAEFIQVIQAIVILLVAAQMFLAKTRNKIIYKQAQDDLAKEEQPA
jgi:simple sugar transport system permease protein